MTKRRKFIFSSLLLSLGLLSTQFVPIDFRYVAVLALFFISYLISAWALFDDLKGVEWLTIVPLPALYATSVSLFYFLLPAGTSARIIILTLFGLGLYALYLTGNIFSIAAIRTIQLLRAAHAVGFLLTLVTLVFFFNTIFSFRHNFAFNGLATGLITFPLVASALWSVKLENHFDKKLYWYAGVISLLVLETAIAISFMPISVWVASLFLVTVVYVSLGILQHDLSDRLFDKTLQEYVGVGVFVIIATILVTQWK